MYTPTPPSLAWSRGTWRARTRIIGVSLEFADRRKPIWRASPGPGVLKRKSYLGPLWMTPLSSYGSRNEQVLRCAALLQTADGRKVSAAAAARAQRSVSCSLFCYDLLFILICLRGVCESTARACAAVFYYFTVCCLRAAGPGAAIGLGAQGVGHAPTRGRHGVHGRVRRGGGNYYNH